MVHLSFFVLFTYHSLHRFSYNENEKHISASVEPGGLHFSGLMDDDEWQLWVKEIKAISTKELGYKVGEIETGEVDY